MISYQKHLCSLLLLGAFRFFADSCLAEQLPLKLFTTADGLGSNTILDIYCDSKGLLWFSTRDGLSRFDGYGFTTYDRDDGLPEPAISSVYETHDGTYWVVSNKGILSQYRPPTFRGNERGTLYKKLFKEFSDPAKSGLFPAIKLYQVPDQTLWVAADDGLMEIDIAKGSVRQFHLPYPGRPTTGMAIYTIADDRKGSFWLATSQGVVRFLVDDRRFVHYLSFPAVEYDLIYALHLDEQGRLWIGHDGLGLDVAMPEPIEAIGRDSVRRWNVVHSRKLPSRPLDIVRFTANDGIGGNSIDAICSAGGRIWLGTSDGLGVYENGAFHSYTMNHGLCSKKITSLVEDRHGNLWIGTSNGVQKLQLNGMLAFNEQDGLPNEPVYSLVETGDGTVTAIVGKWILAQLHDTRFVIARPTLPGGATSIWASQMGFLDRSGEWWLYSSEGLYRYGRSESLRELHGKNPLTTYSTGNGAPSTSFTRMYEDRDGNFWLGLRSGGDTGSGLCRFDRRSGRISLVTPEEGLPGGLAPSAFAEDSAGNLWIGFYRGGMARYSNGKFRHWTDPSTQGETITSLYTDHSGRLWRTSNISGLSYLQDLNSDEHLFIYVTQSQGLSSDNTRCLVEDRWGRIYVGTVRGVDRYDPATGLVSHFSRSEGLLNDFVVCALRDRSDRLWFGTMGGISVLVPEEPSVQRAPPIYISAIRVDGAPFLAADMGLEGITGIEFEPGQKNIQVDFFSIGNSYGRPVQYQFKLHQDDRWSYPISERSINYVESDPGSYEFMVRAANADGVVSSTPARFVFRILPHLWQRWWFLSLAGIALSALLYLIHLTRLRKAIELERLRIRIASDLHDEVGSALTQIAVHSEIIQRAEKPEKVFSSSQTIGTVSREVVRTLGDIVWSIDARHDTFGQLIGRMKSFALDICGPKDVGVHFDFEGIPEQRKIPVELRENLYLIYKEALTNIARHSDATRVDVALKCISGRLVLEIHDNGSGPGNGGADRSTREGSSLCGGHGLKNMQMRSDRIGGKLELRNHEGFHVILVVTAP